MSESTTSAASSRCRQSGSTGHRQALPRGGGQPRRRRRDPPGHRARPGRRERRRQVDADEDPVRRAEARRGHDRGRRRAGRASRRPRDAIAQRHRHGVPALPAGRQPHRARERRARRREAARHRRRGPARDRADLRRRTASTSTPTSWSRRSGSGSGSGSRSSRSSTAGRASSSSTSRPRCWCRRRSTRCSPTCASSSARGTRWSSSRTSSTRCSRSPTTSPCCAGARPSPRCKPADVTPHDLAELMVGAELPEPEHGGVDGHRPGACSRCADLGVDDAPAARCSTTSPSPSTPARCWASPASRATARPSWSRPWSGMRPAADRHRRARRHRRDAAGATRERREAGVGYIPEDRQRHGLLLDAPLWENRILGHQTRPPSAKGVWLDRAGARAGRPADRRRSTTSARPGIDTTARALSGGNQQKFIVGREMSGDPVLLVASHPTRGVDVGAQAADLGPHPGGAAAGPGGAADLGRPRRADRPLRHDPGGAARPAGRRVRPADGDPAAARLGDDRCRGAEGRRRMSHRDRSGVAARRSPAPVAGVRRGRRRRPLVLLGHR